MPSQGWNYAPAEEQVVYEWSNGLRSVSIGEWVGPWGWVDVWEWSDGGHSYVCWRNDGGDEEVPVEGNYPDLGAAMDAVERAFGAAAVA